jgi:hypothetical protein
MKGSYLIMKAGVRIFSLLFSFNFSAFSQINLVPNPSFEIYDTCPNSSTGYGQICRAVPWFDTYSPNPINCGGSTDFFHVCEGSVPNTPTGSYQQPRSGNGFAHALILVRNQDLYREYFEVELINALIPNKKYCGSFYITFTLNQYSQFSCDCITASFSNDTLKQYGSFDIINAPTHIKSQTIITDTVNWQLIKGVFTAGGGEKFMTVGCFLPFAQINYICYTPLNDCVRSGYFFDDFGVYELPEIEAGNNDSICTIGGSVQLNANCTGCWPGLQYRWWPAVGLNDTTILNPTASPSQTTTYYFGLTDTSNTVPCIVDLIDSVTVYVCDSVANPTASPNTGFTFSIYPNPGQATVTLNFTSLQEDVIMHIYDARGRLVLKQNISKGSKTMELNIANLASGVYVLKLQNSEIKEIRKFVKT